MSEPPAEAPARTVALTRDRSRDAMARTTETLRQMILSGEIAPGAELSQVELARMVGVSTTPVREALRQLEVEGLVESRRNRRPRVPAFDPGDLDAVYCTRVLLESLAISITVPRMSRAELAEIGGDLDAMREAGSHEDLAAWDIAHTSFHTRLIFGCEPALRRQIRLMMSRADHYRRMSVLSERPFGWRLGESEHAAILDACETRDPQLAAVLLSRHLARSARAVLAHLAPEREAVSLDAALRMVGAEG
jgi:DNA-binding GntR family transcriptional regulator